MQMPEGVRPRIAFSELVESRQRADRERPFWEAEAEAREAKKREENLLTFKREADDLLDRYDTKTRGRTKTTKPGKIVDDKDNEWQIRVAHWEFPTYNPGRIQQTYRLQIKLGRNWMNLFTAGYLIKPGKPGEENRVVISKATTPESQKKKSEADNREVNAALMTLGLLQRSFIEHPQPVK